MSLLIVERYNFTDTNKVKLTWKQSTDLEHIGLYKREKDIFINTNLTQNDDCEIGIYDKTKESSFYWILMSKNSLQISQINVDIDLNKISKVYLPSIFTKIGEYYILGMESDK